MASVQKDLNGDPNKSTTAEKQLLGVKPLVHEDIHYKLYIIRTRKFKNKKPTKACRIVLFKAPAKKMLNVLEVWHLFQSIRMVCKIN